MIFLRRNSRLQRRRRVRLLRPALLLLNTRCPVQKFSLPGDSLETAAHSLLEIPRGTVRRLRCSGIPQELLSVQRVGLP